MVKFAAKSASLPGSSNVDLLRNIFIASTCTVSGFYVVSQRALYPRDWWKRVMYLPFLMAMGIGFVVIASPYYAESIQRQLCEDRVPTYEIGEVREGEPGVDFVD